MQGSQNLVSRRLIRVEARMNQARHNKAFKKAFELVDWGNPVDMDKVRATRYPNSEMKILLGLNRVKPAPDKTGSRVPSRMKLEERAYMKEWEEKHKTHFLRCHNKCGLVKVTYWDYMPQMSNPWKPWHCPQCRYGATYTYVN
jgi:hypothetical protein